jgi:hypothetical protein
MSRSRRAQQTRLKQIRTKPYIRQKLKKQQLNNPELKTKHLELPLKLADDRRYETASDD